MICLPEDEHRMTEGKRAQSELSVIRRFYRKVQRATEKHKYYEKYPLNIFWGNDNLKIMRDLIGKAKTLTDLVHGAQRTFMFSVNIETSVKVRAVEWLIEKQCAVGLNLTDFSDSICESEHSFDGNNVVYNGRRVTPDFLRTVSISAEISRWVVGRELKPNHMVKAPISVIELGGGLGHLARTMRLLGISRSHVIVDLPETLAFAMSFLQLNYPEARFLLVSDPEMANGVDLTDFDFVFVPVVFSEALIGTSFDLFLNTASLGEMRNETIRYWMDLVQNNPFW